jgi:hypothetical protein
MALIHRMSKPAGAFTATHWSIVLAAAGNDSPAAQDALARVADRGGSLTADRLARRPGVRSRHAAAAHHRNGRNRRTQATALYQLRQYFG